MRSKDGSKNLERPPLKMTSLLTLSLEFYISRNLSPREDDAGGDDDEDGGGGGNRRDDGDVLTSE